MLECGDGVFPKQGASLCLQIRALSSLLPPSVLPARSVMRDGQELRPWEPCCPCLSTSCSMDRPPPMHTPVTLSVWRTSGFPEPHSSAVLEQTGQASCRAEGRTGSAPHPHSGTHTCRRKSMSVSARGEVSRSQVHFHPGLRPKGKQVYLDSWQGAVGWPHGAGLGLSGVGMWLGGLH